MSEMHPHLIDMQVNDTIIILTGDNCIGVRSYDEDIDQLIRLDMRLQDRNNILCVIRGDYDNPKYFKALSAFRKSLSDYCQHTFLLPDYSTITTRSHKILCVGGGRSMTEFNKNGRHRWDGTGVQRPTSNIPKGCDVMVSHMCPRALSNGIPNDQTIQLMMQYDKRMMNDIDRNMRLLDQPLTCNDIKTLVCGHLDMNDTNAQSTDIMVKSLDIFEHFSFTA